MTRRALAVEDEAAIVQSYRRAFARRGWKIERAGSIEEARRFFVNWNADSYDAVLLDIGLPDGEGDSLLPEIDQLEPRPLVVVVSGFLTPALEIRFQRHAVKFCTKPAKISELLELFELAELSQAPNADDRVIEYCAQKQLGKRETEALLLLLKGQSRADVANQMGCSKNTVDSHLKRIFRKTGIPSFEGVLIDVVTHLRRSAPREDQEQRERSSTKGSGQ